MQFGRSTKNAVTVFTRLAKYNLKIIFSNKFIYFLLGALFIFILVTAVNLMSTDSQPDEETVFWIMLVPGILLIFYPVTFGIQNDVDNRMIEILFGIPNYRYKIWLLRLALIFSVTLIILFFISLISYAALSTIPIGGMLYHLMFPIVFLGCLAFMVTTLIRDGSGTAVTMFVFGMMFWVNRQFFETYPVWDIFLNPFSLPQNINETIWAGIITDNRIFLLAGSVFAVLYGLLNLQKREKFL